MDTHAQIDIPLLVGAGVLFLLGLSLVRFPKQSDYAVRLYTATLMRAGGVPRTAEMRALGVISLIAGVALAAKAFGAI